NLDGIDPLKEKRWMHHYAFPSFSVGEVRPSRGPGRREIGHGALAERAVAASLPTKEAFPYTLRVNSEVLESNGSSSMASTCGATLALMDAGVPLQTVVGGIAMGLIKEGDRAVILSDIQGLEDFLGDMDFKVTGNREGISALQMDIKIEGISVELMRQALEQARQGRIHILEKMAEAITEPRKELSSSAPRIITIKVDQSQIGTVIGPGGKMIRSIIETTGATIDIEDDGTVIITSADQGGEQAREIIMNLTKKILPGEYYKGKINSIIPIGAFVELLPGKDGMVHISQFPVRIPAIEAVVSVGDEVLVKVVDVDDRGRINLSMRGITDEQRAEFGLDPFVIPDNLDEYVPAPAPPRREGGYNNRGGGGGDRGSRGPRY
ncbi:MAG: polyribonucleotide nucleotidyltransferase, partial [Candidatus Melainabacteria bacterium]|nr:polyribonucleotide nucleotidyltransferase [Candidatus Melainabacteria bacterium]